MATLGVAGGVVGIEPVQARSLVDRTAETVAGTGAAGNGVSPGLAAATTLRSPSASVADAFGNVYVADNGNCVIRRIDRAGVSRIVAGTLGQCGYADDGSRIKDVTGLAINPTSKFLAFASSSNCVVQRLDVTTHRVSHIAGVKPVGTTPQCGYTSGTGRADAIMLQGPTALAFANTGYSNDVYVAEGAGCGVRKLAESGGAWTSSLYAGLGGAGTNGANCATATTPAPTTATSAKGLKLGALGGIAVTVDRRVYVSDTTLNIVRRIDPPPAATPTAEPTIATVAGTPGVSGFADGAPGAGRLTAPRGLAVDNVATNPVVYVADLQNCRVRAITPGATPSLSTVAGGNCDLNAPTGDGGPVEGARFRNPVDVKVTSHGDLLVTDVSAHRVRRLLTVGTKIRDAVIGTPDAGNDAIFRAFGNNSISKYDWTGSDGAFSVPLPDGRILWLFGDTIPGVVNPATGARTDASPWATNTAALMASPTDPGARLYPISTGNGVLAVPNPDPTACSGYWPSTGLVTGTTTVQLIMACVNKAGAIVHTDLWQLSEASKGGAWTATRLVAPFTRAFAGTPREVCGGQILFGNAIVPTDPVLVNGSWQTDTYVYGLESHCVGGNPNDKWAYAHVARVRVAGKVPSLNGAWTYFETNGSPRSAPVAGDASTTRLRKVLNGKSEMLARVGNEYSVTKVGTGAATKYRLVASDTSLGWITSYTSSTPFGPWYPAPGEVIHTPYEMQLNQRPPYNAVGADLRDCVLAAYNAKEHPALGDGDRMVVSYNVGVTSRAQTEQERLSGYLPVCNELAAFAANVDNYRPRFISVPI